MKRLFTDNKEWSLPALRIANEFRQYFARRIDEYSEYSIRDLEAIAHSTINEAALNALITHRFSSRSNPTGHLE